MPILRTVDNTILDMKHDFDFIKRNIISVKYKFCRDFEKELKLEPSEYSENVFDYIYNLFNFRPAFAEPLFKKRLDEFKELDFKRPQETGQYMKTKYTEFILLNKKYFMDYFGFTCEDELYMARKIFDNKQKFRIKLAEYIS